MRVRWQAALGLGMAAWLVAGVVLYVADWREDSRRLAVQRETQREWESWIATSCDLPDELASGLSKELAFWDPWDSPVYLLSDFERIVELEALSRPSFAVDLNVPTDPAGLVRYRFQVAAGRLALADSPKAWRPSPVIDSCAGEVYKALMELDEEVKALMGEVLGEEGVDYDEFGPLPRVDAD